MLDQIKYTFGGANRDVSKSKHPAEFYYDGQHIRLLSTDTQSSGSITNEKGNTKVMEIPDISIDGSSFIITYGNKELQVKNTSDLVDRINDGSLSLTSGPQTIIGHVSTRDSIVFFSTDDNGFDCVWELQGVLNEQYDLTLLYVRDMGFNTNTPIQALFNYENENIQKIYWVDGVHQIRFLNIKQEDLIETPLNSINLVGNFDLSQPVIDSISSGGNHTAGMVQYAYNLYRINASQTKISPFSQIIPLTRGEGLGGGEVNELISSTPVVKIDSIDLQYTHIKVYAIRYTSLNVIPSVDIIEERELGTNGSLTIYDDGGNIGSISLEELLFLGSDPITPLHITTKDNILFPVNIKENNFDIPNELDCRAYSFDSTGRAAPRNNMRLNDSGAIIGDPIVLEDTGNGISFDVPDTFDASNISYDLYKYQSNGITFGGEGKYLKYEIAQKGFTKPEDHRFFKDNEVYRIGIEFYNVLGQKSLPKWISDFKTPMGNLIGNYNTLKVTLKPEFYTWLDNYVFEDEEHKITGYKIIRADRTFADRTIICQGVLTPMIFQVKGTDAQNANQFHVFDNRKPFQDTSLKIPTYLTREFQKMPPSSADNNNGVLQETKHLQWLNDNANLNNDEGGEIYNATRFANKISQTFEFTKMFQMCSPEILFDVANTFPSDVSLDIRGLCKASFNGVFAEERYIDTTLEKFGGKANNGINPLWIPSSDYVENNSFDFVFTTPEGDPINNTFRFIGPTGGGPELTMGFYQYYRQFNTFLPNTLTNEYNIYGAPEYTGRGADSRFYNNDTRYQYSNSLTTFLSHGEDDCDTCQPIISINSYGSATATIMLGDVDDSTEDRKSLEEIFNDISVTDSNGVLLSELKRNKNFIYLGGIYGGNTYEDKKRTNYIQIGEYREISESTVQIDDPGDTYVQTFRSLRIGKTDLEIYDHTQQQNSEILEFKVETTIDLKNRYDISLNSWDSRFQPRYEEYHGYNTVYSQQPTLIQNTDVDFNFQEVKEFDTRIAATKTKIPNENIDSWTDITVNNTMDLDGKYGPINSVVNSEDEIYALQDKAVAQLIINPRIQVQGTTGLGIELGKGDVLYDYKYITTESGCSNKWASVSSKQGFYYYDIYNKGLFKYPEAIKVPLSDIKGFHSYFNNNYVYNDLILDNPVKKKGAVLGYDSVNHDIYITLLQGDSSFTRCYNELKKEFVDLKTYTPSRYINNGNALFITDPNDNKLYEQFKGEYNNFFGEYQISYIILQVNPNVNLDSMFHNIFYRSEVYLDDIDQSEKTLTHIHAYNEYQDSGRIPLTLGRNDNLRRKFRQWRADIPRNNESRDRLRNPWIFLKLEFENTENYSMILHDIIVNYNVYY